MVKDDKLQALLDENLSQIFQEQKELAIQCGSNAINRFQPLATDRKDSERGKVDTTRMN